MNLTGKLISLLGASCLVAFATAAPASAHTKPCCYNNGGYFNATPSTCYRYGGRVIQQQYCQGNYQGNYGNYQGNYGGYYDNDDRRSRRHRRHDRDGWGGEGEQRGWDDHRDRHDRGDGDHYRDGGEGDRDRRW